MTSGDWVTVVGLGLDALGAGLILWPLFRLTNEQAKRDTSHGLRSSGPTDALFRNRAAARKGLLLLILGFVLQAVGTILN